MKSLTVSQVKQSVKTFWNKKYVSFETRKKWQLGTTTLCAAAFVSGIIILFIMGGSIYAEEHPKELTYAENVCQVYAANFSQYWCGGGRQRRTRCYAPVWDIVYGENQTINATIIGYNRYRAKSDAIKKANEYQIGSSYPCWYDTTNAFAVQWEQPNSRTGVILLVVGGLTIIPLIISTFLTFRICVQIRRHYRK